MRAADVAAVRVADSVSLAGHCERGGDVPVGTGEYDGGVETDLSERDRDNNVGGKGEEQGANDPRVEPGASIWGNDGAKEEAGKAKPDGPENGERSNVTRREKRL